MKKIGIVSLRSINNAGDEILADTTEYLVKLNQDDKYLVKQIELNPKNPKLNIIKKALVFLIHNGNIFLFKMNNYFLSNLEYRLKYTSYYREEFSSLDAVITAVGMLKYSTQGFSYIFKIISETAEKLNIPVMISATSPQVPDDSDMRSRQLKKAMHSPSIKVVTTRDGIDGVTALKEHYLNENVICDFVGDPALWIPDLYGIKKNETNIVGIGLVKKNNFTKYGGKLKSNELVEVYLQLLKKLDGKKIEWQLFSNGMEADEEFGKMLLELGNYDDSKMAKRPANARELIETVSNYKAILGVRLHSCLTAFSLGVPLAGLVWDNKSLYFAKTMKLEKYFFNENEMDIDKITDTIENLKPDYCDKENMNIYKNKTKEAIDLFLQNYVD